MRAVQRLGATVFRRLDKKTPKREFFMLQYYTEKQGDKND